MTTGCGMLNLFSGLGVTVATLLLHENNVMQSDANNFGGDVVLDTFNNVSRDEDNILDQIYIKQICSDFYYEDLKFWKRLKKKHI